jgi:hypothetical protein
LNSTDGLNPLFILTTITIYILPLTLSTLTITIDSPYLRTVLLITLTCLLTILPDFFKIINYSKINIGLANPLGQYHPPLLFFAIILGFVYLTLGLNNRRVQQTSLMILLTSLYLSG